MFWNRLTTDSRYKICADACPTSADPVFFAGDDPDVLLGQISLTKHYLRVLDGLPPERKSRPDLRYYEGELYLQLMALKEGMRVLAERN